MPLRATLLFVMLCAFASANGASITPRIIGGSDAGAGQYPFTAALAWSDITSNDFDAIYCGSTVIAPRWILTAGHCVTDTQGKTYPPALIDVIAGVTTLDNVSASATRTAVNTIIRHPAYNDDTLDNDLALLHLASDVAVAPSFELAANDPAQALPGVNTAGLLLATGWGVTATDGSTRSPTLQAVTLDYFTFATCNDNSHYAGQLRANNLCAGFLDSTPRDTCLGDSGGPLLRPLGGGAYRQVGITSYGDSAGCALAQYPGVYTAVAPYREFIDGAQTEPDLAVTAASVPGSQSGNRVTVRFTVRNKSPLHDATQVELTTARTGAISITGTAGTHSCTDSSGDRVCALGTLAANGSTTVDVAIELGGDGQFNLHATVDGDNGDYYAANNTTSISYAVSTRKSGGGALPPVLLVLLATLAWRRARRR